MLPRSLLLLISIKLTILDLVPLLLLLISCAATASTHTVWDYLCIRQFRWIQTLVRTISIGCRLHFVTPTRHRRPMVNFVKCARCTLVLPRWRCSTLCCRIIHHLWVIMIDRVLLVIVGIDGAELPIWTSHICWMFYLVLRGWSLLRWTLCIPCIKCILFIAAWVHFCLKEVLIQSRVKYINLPGLITY